MTDQFPYILSNLLMILTYILTTKDWFLTLHVQIIESVVDDTEKEKIRTYARLGSESYFKYIYSNCMCWWIPDCISVA